MESDNLETNNGENITLRMVVDELKDLKTNELKELNEINRRIVELTALLNTTNHNTSHTYSSLQEIKKEISKEISDGNIHYKKGVLAWFERFGQVLQIFCERNSVLLVIFFIFLAALFGTGLVLGSKIGYDYYYANAKPFCNIICKDSSKWSSTWEVQTNTRSLQGTKEEVIQYAIALNCFENNSATKEFKLE